MCLLSSICPIRPQCIEFIASPNDTNEECKAVTEAVYSWNDTNSFRHKVILEPVKWETHAKPEISDEGGQEIINKQLVRACDILIGNL